jgi:BASS family bile acid:Na+ symporter
MTIPHSHGRAYAEHVTEWLRRRLGRTVALAYLAAVLLPGPGQWLRHAHTPAGTDIPLHTASLLLSLVLFSAGLQVPVRALGQLLRQPRALLAGLVLHLAAPLLIIPLVAYLLRHSPDADGGSGLVTAMILIVAMPVAAGATVWTGKGHGDQPTMVGLVLASTLISPITIPVTVGALAPLLSGGYADVLGTVGRAMNSGFAFTGVVLPCAAGVACRLALPTRLLEGALRWVVPVALAGSVVLTYVNASGALGAFLAHPRPLLLIAAPIVSAVVCALSFAVGRLAARVLRLDAPAASSLTLACGMNNSSAGAVLITTTLPDKPHLLLPVLAYGLLQKTAANGVVRMTRPQRPPKPPCPASS